MSSFNKFLLLGFLKFCPALCFEVDCVRVFLFSGCKKLVTLHSHFKDVVCRRGIRCLSFAEGSKTDLPFNYKAIIVPADSSGKIHYSGKIFVTLTRIS